MWKSAAELYGPLDKFIREKANWGHDWVHIGCTPWKGINVDDLTRDILNYFELEPRNTRDARQFADAWRDINRATDSREHELNVQAMRMRLPVRFWYRFTRSMDNRALFGLVWGNEDNAESISQMWSRVPSARKEIPDLHGFHWWPSELEMKQLFLSGGKGASTAIEMFALSADNESRRYSWPQMLNPWHLFRADDRETMMENLVGVTGRRPRGGTFHQRMKSLVGDCISAANARCEQLKADGRYVLMVGTWRTGPGGVLLREYDWSVTLSYGPPSGYRKYGGVHDFYIMRSEYRK